MTEKPRVVLHRTERTLLLACTTLVALSLAALGTTTVAALVGNVMSGALWPTLIAIGYFGLPLAFVCATLVIVIGIVRRRNAKR